MGSQRVGHDRTTEHITDLCVLIRFSCVQLFATPWTVIRQVPQFIGFSRQEYWSGLPVPPPGDLPDAGIEPETLKTSPALAVGFFTTSITWEGLVCSFWKYRKFIYTCIYVFYFRFFFL